MFLKTAGAHHSLGARIKRSSPTRPYAASMAIISINYSLLLDSTTGLCLRNIVIRFAQPGVGDETSNLGVSTQRDNLTHDFERATLTKYKHIY